MDPPSYPARGNAANIVTNPSETRAYACKPLSLGGEIRHVFAFFTLFQRKNYRFRGIRPGIRPQGPRESLEENGRPDGWLYVGGTKAGPAVLWLYPFGGAPNGHKAGQ